MSASSPNAHSAHATAASAPAGCGTPPPPATSPQAAVVRREDYRAPDWLAESLVLHVVLARDRTVVTAACHYRRAADALTDAPLYLDGEGLETLAIQIDDQPLPASQWQMADGQLCLSGLPAQFTLHTQVAINPSANLELSGLYASGGMLLTQCEAQGFRRITWFQDRPDVMTTYRVILQARQADYPVLLANGNLLAADALAARDALQQLALPLPALAVADGSTPASAISAAGSATPPERAAHTDDGRARIHLHPVTGTPLAGAPGWHQAVWEDPFPKPSYLFALVAGRLAVNESPCRLADGREVLLQVWADAAQIGRTDFALASLKKSIAWDEQRYGLSLDLDRFMIVAAADFNMGAMENKGLNIFNAKYLFADPEVATDTDFEWIESIIAHEYFHNWTGNRITCRDWFQLTLKEGLTVFRDQEFTADVMAADAGPRAAASVRALQRMANVRALRQTQFAEDAGPMRHPVRPDSYQAIDNFYTATVYEKGAEVVRMQQTLVGVDGFRRGMDLYFARHDGQAVTCEAFVAAMADANGRDLSQFMRWYGTAGTPHVRVHSHYDATSRRLHLTMTQLLPDADGQLKPAGARALHIPVATALLSRRDGRELASALLELRESTQVFSFDDIDPAEGEATGSADLAAPTDPRTAPPPSQPDSTAPAEGPSAQPEVPEASGRANRGPILSLLRDFSAPVIIEHDYSDGELAFLLAHDGNPFNRWEAGQQLSERALLRAVRQPDAPNPTLPVLAQALQQSLQDPGLDDGLRQQMLLWPDENRLAEQLALIDPAALRQARQGAIRQLLEPLQPWLRQQVQARHWQAPWSLSVAAVGQRALANTALQLLAMAGDAEASPLARAQFEGADNLTDRLGALQALVQASAADADWALERFERHYAQETNVLDKWFMVQARMHGHDGQPTLARVRQLMKHPAWAPLNPNKVRALLWAFFADNLAEFHRPDGAGYQLWIDEVLRIDRHNPQLAARLARTLQRPERHVAPLAGLMTDALQQVARQAQSPDVREVVAKALGQA
ncbi:MAG: M1 family metallopeptidase [Lautropia sp.]|nr:M1 family metallopeptidase [Lautropia sp.]